MDSIFKNIKKLKQKDWFKINYKPKIKIEGPLNEEKIEKLSEIKNEPKWMLKIRLKAFNIFKKLPLPNFGPKLDINFNKIIYYGLIDRYPKPKNWNELPSFIKESYLKLNLPKEEIDKLHGIQFQFDSHPIFRKISEKIEEMGVIFTSLDEAIIEHKKLVKKFFGKLVLYNENKFAALNTAIWSGGVFIYVPKNIKISFPLHAYFRINLERIGQFERTLIIADKNSKVTYVEGCSAPIYSLASLHAAVTEVFALKNSEVKYITLQNWSKNVYNLPIKRGLAEKNSKLSWISFENGSKITMKYPSLILKDNSIGENLLLTLAGNGQYFDSGGKIICKGKNCKGILDSKAIAIENGKITNRIEITISKGAKNSEVYSKCNALIQDNGKVETIPKINVFEKDCYYNHEGKTESIEEEKLFYLKSKGIEENIAKKLMFFGFFENILERFPEFFKIEIEKVINLRLEEYGGVG